MPDPAPGPRPRPASKPGEKLNQRLGRSGERVAADYLIARGHQVIATNVRRREGEIDLVTLDRGTLVFVEVKLRRPSAYGAAVEALSPARQRRMVAVAEAYAAEHPELPSAQRIDLVAIDLSPTGTPEVRHIENAVEA